MFPEIGNPIQNLEYLEGNDKEIVDSELVEAIKKSIEPIIIQGYRKGQTFLAIGSQHGQRLMLQINVHASEIPTLLRSRSVAKDSNDPTSGKHRPIDEKHVTKIKDYIRERAKAGKNGF